MIYVFFTLFISIVFIDFLVWKLRYNNVMKKEHTYTYTYGSLDIKVDELPRFKFDQFIKFYNLNPESWELWTKYNTYLPAKKSYEDYPVSTGYCTKQYYRTYYYHVIGFPNIIEYRKYYKWAKSKQHKMLLNNQTKAQNAATKKICELVQKDIDAARADLEQALNQTENTLTEVLQRERKS